MQSDLGDTLDPGVHFTCLLILFQGDLFMQISSIHLFFFFFFGLVMLVSLKKEITFFLKENYEELSYTLKTTLNCEEGA